MLYSKHIPERLRTGNVEKLATVLDEIQQYKEAIIHKANRFYNPVLNTHLSFLRESVEELGWPKVPYDFPKEILDNMFLNAEHVHALLGSKMGFDYWLRVLTCGAPVIDDDNFYPKPAYIILSDAEAGHLFTEPDFPLDILYLYSGAESLSPRFLTVEVATPYHDLQSLKDYINANVYRYIGFVDENTTVTINFTAGPYVPNPYANPYFVLQT